MKKIKYLKQLSYYADNDKWIAYSTESFCPKDVYSPFSHTIHGSGKTAKQAIRDMENKCTVKGREEMWEKFKKEYGI